MSQIEAVWHNDGHRVIILIDQADVTISLEYCPNGGREGTECYHPESKGCLVKHFIDLYGLEINKGIAPAALFKEISWTFLEGQDLYSSEAHIMPNEDESFRSWIEEQMGDVDTTGFEN